MIRAAFVSGLAAIVGGCAPVSAVPPVQSIDLRAPLPACPVIAASDFTAFVNAMPGPDARPTLIVTGTVTAPTGGYTFTWRDFRVMESYPVQVAVELVPIPPSGGATQAVVTHEVRGQWPISPPVGSVTVTCGNRSLARISPVETAH